MTIDTSRIDANAVALISDAVAGPHREPDPNISAETIRTTTLGYIKGILDMAAVLKEDLQVVEGTE
jgi:hypothetical protein